jgi:hypothetical protein
MDQATRLVEEHGLAVELSQRQTGSDLRHERLVDPTEGGIEVRGREIAT